VAVLKGGSSAHVPSPSRKAGGKRRQGGCGGDREEASRILAAPRSAAGDNSLGSGWGPGTRHRAELARGFRVSS